MPTPKNRFLEPSHTLRQIIIFIAILSTLFLVHASLVSLRYLKTSQSLPETSRMCFVLFFFSFPILTGWSGLKRKLAIPIGTVAIFINVLAIVVTGRLHFAPFFALLGGLYFLLDWYDKKTQDDLLLNEVEIEKAEVENNQIENELKRLKEEVDSSLSKYTTYYGLRQVAEEFATTLSLDDISRIVVEKVRSFIPKGDSYLLYLAEVEEAGLSLIASSAGNEEERIMAKKGDFFDHSVLKNRKHLFVTDTERDVFFDTKQTEAGGVRSVMIAPLVSEGRVIGTFRVNSMKPECFEIDDLRLLDFITALASSAISNALLYQKTEELAIRDSLTGLYVQRYFKDRLKEEHRRALLTNTPLSVLMCDLDRFKSYNDTFGHAAGDMILLKVSQIFREEVGEEGIVARYGGEEIAVLLPRLSKDEAAALAERIRKKVESAQIDVRREPTRITISIGVSAFPEDTMEREELIRKADESLYTAKRGGRNRIVAYGRVS